MLLKGNMQPTDFADSDCRVSPWVETAGRDGWGPENLVSAYRIWVCRCSAYWFQRHEWIHKGENKTRMDDWIFYGYHPHGKFPPHMVAAPNMEDI